MGAPDESERAKLGGSRLEKITNLAILATLLFLLLNPSGLIGSWFGRQFAETRARRAVEGLWGELTDSASFPVPVEQQVPAGAPIIVEFLDYQCPACRAVAPVVADAWERGTATIVVRHLPLEQIHAGAREAAKAVVCAEWQGRLRAAHHALMGEGDWVSRRDWVGFAEEVGIADPGLFAECLVGEEAEERVENDLRIAAGLGITSTPTFVTPQGIYGGTGGFQAALEGTLSGTN